MTPEPYDPQNLVGRTIVSIEIDEGDDSESWCNTEAFITLDNGTVVELYASGWHDSGSLSFWARGSERTQ